MSDGASAQFSSLPSPIEPPYLVEGVNDSILLHFGDLLVVAGGSVSRVTGAIRWEWLPTPHVRYEFSTDALEEIGWGTATAFEVSIPDEVPLSCEKQTLPTNLGVTPDVFRAGGWLGNVQRGSATDVRRVTFQVANMPTVHRDWLNGPGGQWNGHLRFQVSEWCIVLDARRDWPELQKELKRRGGYAVTHGGELTRLDGASLSEEEISSAFHLLRSCLSFAFGRMITPSLAAGFNAQNELIWLDWRAFSNSPWQGADSILDESSYGDLGRLLNGFSSLWGDPFMSELLSNAVHYYVECNDPNPIPLAVSDGQAGLELLAYEKLVEETGTLTHQQYMDARVNPAHSKISRLLHSYGVADDIPASLNVLSAAAQRQSCATGPEVLTRMRNGVMHPSRNKPKFSNDEWVDAWVLTKRYLILSILGRIDFTGSYRDPLNRETLTGATTKVPWV